MTNAGQAPWAAANAAWDEPTQFHGQQPWANQYATQDQYFPPNQYAAQPPYDAQYPFSPQPPPGSPPPKNSQLRLKITVAVAAIALGVAGGAVWAGVLPTSASADTVNLEPVAFAGDSPFLATPVGQDKTNVMPPAKAGGTFAGDTAGLYGDTGDQPSCDATALVTGLQADPAKAAAWSMAEGITPDAIPMFVSSLSPVVLRSDTAVTNYNFKAGQFAPQQSVLQAGTAAFINSYGEPTVKCFSGNPLAKPTSAPTAETTFVGQTWADWEPQHCTVIYPTEIVIKKHIYIDIDTHEPVEKPGKPDTKEHPGPNPTPETPDTENTPKPDPALEMAAKDAQMRLGTATKEATDARAAANDKKAEATIFDTDARNLETAATTAKDAVTKAQAKADATQDPFARAAAQLEVIQAQINAAQADKLAMDARAMATDKANQLTNAEAAARSAEGVRDMVTTEAKMKQDAADKAAGRTPADPAGTTPPAGTQKQLAGTDTPPAGTDANADKAAATGTDPATPPAANADGTTAPATKADGTIPPAGDGTTGATGTTPNGANTPGATGTTPNGGEAPGTDPATSPFMEGTGTAGTTPPATDQGQGTGTAGGAAATDPIPPAGGPGTPPAGNTGIAGGTPGADGVPPTGPAQDGPTPQGGGQQGGDSGGNAA